MKDNGALPLGLLEPTPITQARFQAAYQRSDLSSEERHRRREMRRVSFRPPGWLDPEWSLAAPMRYCVGSVDSEECYTVPEGYTFDGATVPWPLTLVVPRTHSSYMGAAALHDYLYQYYHDRMTRGHADAIFCEAMLVLGLNWVWAWLMWRSVRAAGWMVWYRRKPATFAGRFLKLPVLIRWPLGMIWTAVLGLYGAVFVDMLNFGKYRRISARIAAKDGRAEAHTP